VSVIVFNIEQSFTWEEVKRVQQNNRKRRREETTWLKKVGRSTSAGDVM